MPLVPRPAQLALLVATVAAAPQMRGVRQAAGADWPTYLGDSARTHYSPLTQIPTHGSRGDCHRLLHRLSSKPVGLNSQAQSQV